MGILTHVYKNMRHVRQSSILNTYIRRVAVSACLSVCVCLSVYPSVRLLSACYLIVRLSVETVRFTILR